MGESSVDEASRLVDREAAAGVDLVVLPETWTGKRPESLDGPATQAMAARGAGIIPTSSARSIGRPASRRSTRPCCSIATVRLLMCTTRSARYRMSTNRRIGAARTKASQTSSAGRRPRCVQTDFGKLGLAICYDISFPEIWQQLADQGAEIVAWPSRVSRWLVAPGARDQPSLLHRLGDAQPSPEHELSGDRPHWQAGRRPGHPDGQARWSDHRAFTLDLDRAFYSHDYGYLTVARRLVAEHPGEVEIETYMPHEAWFILCALKPGVYGASWASSTVYASFVRRRPTTEPRSTAAAARLCPTPCGRSDEHRERFTGSVENTGSHRRDI